jgi:hypothetical protein
MVDRRVLELHLKKNLFKLAIAAATRARMNEVADGHATIARPHFSSLMAEVPAIEKSSVLEYRGARRTGKTSRAETITTKAGTSTSSNP